MWAYFFICAAPNTPLPISKGSFVLAKKKHVLEAACNVPDGGFKKPHQHLPDHCEAAAGAAAWQHP